MKVIENNIIPFQGFLAMNLFGFCFVRKEAWARRTEERKKVVINHESIHTEQMKELGYVFFYIIYFFEWLLRLFTNPKNAYRSISFEQEAYDNENDFDYIANRKHYAQWKKKK